MNPAVEQLEVVSQDQQRADRDEDEQSEPDGGHTDDAERARDQQTAGSDARRATRIGMRGAQRAPVQLVECMGRDADGEEEREQRRERGALHRCAARGSHR